jgi:hypothetical protein
VQDSSPQTLATEMESEIENLTPIRLTAISCALCSRTVARGFAVLDARRYCVGEQRPTCFDLAQEITITEDGRAIPTHPLPGVSTGSSPPRGSRERIRPVDSEIVDPLSALPIG